MEIIASIIISITSSLISALSAIVVCILNNNTNHKKWMAEFEKRDEIQAYRIQQLEKKVDLHNNVIERMYHLEEKTAVHDEKIKVVNHRLDNLENKNGG